MKKIILLVFFIGFCSCKQKNCFDERSIVEIKMVYSKDSLNHKYFQTLKEYKLTKEDTNLTEKLIEKAFLKFNNNLNRGSHRFEKLPSFKKYGYILSPCINEDGDKIVLINAYLTNGYCPNLGTLEEWFEVRDGGNSLIMFRINLSAKTVSSIFPNGRA